MKPATLRWMARIQASLELLQSAHNERSGRTGEVAAAATCSVADRTLLKERTALMELLHKHGIVIPRAVPSGHTTASWGVPCPSDARWRLTTLVRITQQLRALERTPEFARGLVASTAEVASQPGSADYSRDNFSFGSTPFHTWFAVFQHPVVAAATAAANVGDPCAAGAHVAVFGSSYGLLAFNCALALGARTVGYDLLPFLTDHAGRVAADNAIPSSLMRFVCADMLTAPLADARVVLLTSQCWDAHLRAAVYAKLDSECRAGCVVVDYVNDLQHHSARFAHVGRVCGEVSWAPSLAFHVFKA